jgi:23S rRNA (adenine2503-C2)-methyltransferase
MPPPPHIKDLTDAALEAVLREAGQPAFRARQLRQWLYRQRVRSFAEMRNLPAALRERLADGFVAFALVCRETQTAADGTVKWLFELPDGETVETVFIPADGRTTVCISTQVGCPVRCAFCASGRDGLVRDLTPGEIVDQVIAACDPGGKRPDNIVVMGIGEPLLNLDAVLPALDRICTPEPDGLGFGARHVTVSTSGIVPGILRLAEAGRQWNLALSLHASNDAARARLIPAAYRYPLAEILDACRTYRERTGRMVTLEYALFRNRNDGDGDAAELAQIARSLRAKVNLIPCNAAGGAFAAPAADRVQAFLARLLDLRVQATVRRRRGEDILAACGQLRTHRDPGPAGPLPDNP